MIYRIFQINIILFALFLCSCSQHNSSVSILDKDGKNNCIKLKEIILENKINNVQIIRPFGRSFDTSHHQLNDLEHLYGERLFTFENEKFQCKDIDSIVYINKDNLIISYNKSGYDNSGPFTQEFVSNYWESGNGYLLNKRLPSFQGYSYSGKFIDLDSLITNSNKTLLHFGWLNCKGCMQEQKEITKLIKETPDIKFVNITIDKPEKLDKYLVDKGEYFNIKPPFNRISNSMFKPILFDDKKNIFHYFHLKGLFPVNFLVDNSGKVEKIGSLIEIFKTESDSIEVFRIN